MNAEQLLRAIASEREYFEIQFSHLRELMDERRDQSNAKFAAEKEAVAKAGVADERRFESVDLFRQQLTEQMRDSMSRNEADVRISGISEKLDGEARRTTERFNELELRLTSRLDLMEGNKQGGLETKAGLYALAGFLLVILTIAGTLAAAGVFGGP